MDVRAEVISAESQSDQRYSLRDAAHMLELPETRLRALARAGMLAPAGLSDEALSFGLQDMELLRTTKGLVESGVPMRRIRQAWASLRAQLAAGAPLSSVMIGAEGERIVATDGKQRWQPDSGQVLLDLGDTVTVTRPEPVSVPAAVTAPPRPTLALVEGRGARPGPPRAARPHDAALSRGALSAPAGEAFDRNAAPDDLYDAGCELEASHPKQAMDAYRRAIELEPGMAEAHVNLGRLLHLAGERGRAEPLYREAVRLDPEDPTPHFNLGVLLDELGRKEEAVLAYRQAIARDLDFVDAHCNLGLLLEALGRRQEAVRHLMAASALKGASE